jgi:hypothetical protein
MSSMQSGATIAFGDLVLVLALGRCPSPSNQLRHRQQLFDLGEHGALDIGGRHARHRAAFVPRHIGSTRLPGGLVRDEGGPTPGQVGHLA